MAFETAKEGYEKYAVSLEKYTNGSNEEEEEEYTKTKINTKKKKSDNVFITQGDSKSD